MKRYWNITPEDYETAEKNGIRRSVLNDRVRNLGWDVDKAISLPLQKVRHWDKWREIAESNGINHRLFNQRIYTMGLEPEEAATIPKGGFPTQRKYPLELFEKAESNGISKNAFYARVNRGWGPERAATVPIMEKYSHKAATK